MKQPIFYAFLFLVSCKSVTPPNTGSTNTIDFKSWHTAGGKNGTDTQLVKIVGIDESSVRNHNLLVCTIHKDTAIIVSDRQSNQRGCDQMISVGDDIKLKLVKKHKIDLDGVNFNLYTQDLFLEGKLIFPKKYRVFSSPWINGLCVIKQP